MFHSCRTLVLLHKMLGNDEGAETCVHGSSPFEARHLLSGGLEAQAEASDGSPLRSASCMVARRDVVAQSCSPIRSSNQSRPTERAWSVLATGSQ